jgi:hypothetical protein
MISLLEEDNDYLRSYIEELELLLKEKEDHLEMLEKEILEVRAA